MSALLDVNTLIALVDTEHVGHRSMEKWFLKNHSAGWATCPVTENGMVRVLSQPAYASGQRTPAEVIEILESLKFAFENSYEFWKDELSLTDQKYFAASLIAGTRQVTDVYLLGLAKHHDATVVSFDRTMAWQGIHGGSQKLIEHPG